MLRALLLILATILPVVVPLTASAETRVALVIGNGAYAHTPALTNPHNDARDMANALQSAGFDVVAALDTDRRAMDQALRQFTDKLTRADVALFYYAGHGLQVGSQNFLVPIDARLERERDLEFEAVRLDFVLRQMEIDREGKTSIVILDACRDNPLSRNLARTMGTRSTAIGRGLAAASTGLGTFIAYSTQPGNVALDGDGRNSPFTAAMVRQMGVAGRNLAATMIEVRKDVVSATSGRQVPWDHSALTGEFYFLPGSSSTAGAVAPANAGPNLEVAALQERLRKLEDDAKQRTTTTTSPTAAADVAKLVELRTRATLLEELTRDLQRKLLTSRMSEGRATDPNEKAKIIRESMAIQMEVTRRSLDLKKIKTELATLESGNAAASTPPPVTTASALPVIPRETQQKVSPNFEVADNVGLLGVEIRSFRAASPVACREACEGERTCAGFQHGRKAPVMGTCELFSRIDARREDQQWRSGLRRADEGATAKPGAGLVFPAPVSRSKQGFHFYTDVNFSGEIIKSAKVDSADACMVVCRNTAGCVAAQMPNDGRPLDGTGNNCNAYSSLRTPASHSGVTAIVRADP